MEFLRIILSASGAGAVYILYNLRKMFKTLLGGNPFVDENSSSLKRISLACTIISSIYFVKCIVSFTWATLVIAVIFTIGGLFSIVLSDLFKQAVKYKEENDYTI